MRRILLVAILFSLFFPSSSQAGTRDFLSVQGLVFDGDGNPLDGDISVTFRLYDAEGAASPLWEEVQSVTFEGGVYSVSLGETTPYPADLFDNESLFLGIEIDGDSEMSPRPGLFSVPFAQQCEVAMTAQSLLDDIVTSSAIAPGAVESSDIAAGAIGSAELASTGVTPGMYTLSTITVDADGRLTAAASGVLPAFGDITGVAAGAGLTGGGTSGDVTLDIGAGTGIRVAADSVGIASGGVTTTEIFDGTITSTDISVTAGITNAQVNNELTIDGGTVDGTPIGGTTPDAGTFSSLEVADTNLTLDSDNAAAGAVQMISFNRGTDDANDAEILWDETDNLFSFSIDGGTTLSRVRGADPTMASDFATKGYVDTEVGGSVPDTRTLSAGDGLTGGGDLSADRTFNVGAGTGISVAADTVGMAMGGVTTPEIFDGTITSTDISGTAGITDGQVSDTLTASIFKGSGTTTDAVDLGSAEVAGTLADANVPNDITINLASAATALAANGTNCSAGSFALGVDASGNAEGCTVAATGTVTSVGSGTGLTGGPITMSGSLSFDYSSTLAGNPALTMGQAVFDSTDKGILFEGMTDDTIEGALQVTSLTSDRTWTLPDTTGTIITTGDSNTVTGAMVDESTLVLTGLVDDDDIAAGAVDGGAAGEIADNTITSDDIGGDAVGASELANDAVDEQALKAVDIAADEECLTFETTTGDFEWQTCGSGSGAPQVNLIFYDSNSMSSGTNTSTDCNGFNNTGTAAARLGVPRYVTMDGFATIRLIARANLSGVQGQPTVKIRNITNGTDLVTISSGWTTTCTTQTATAAIALTGLKQLECQENGSAAGDDPSYAHCSIELIP